MVDYDFSGYATRNDLKCSDGRTIKAGAFKHNDKMRVPLVWQHQHNDPSNVLGHALLENREDGVYAYGFFNDSPSGTHARTLVKHGDVDALSIFANNLTEQNKNVLHGDIKEVSLVLSGANPGAFIDNVNIKHGDISETIEDEAIIYTGLTLEHAADDEGGNVSETATETKTDDKTDDKTVKEVFDSFTEEQKTVVYYMIGEALESAGDDDGEDDDNDEDDTASHSQVIGEIADDVIKHIQEDPNMTRNVFEQNGLAAADKPSLTHDQLSQIVKDAEKMGSFKDSFLAHATEYGFENIDILFPDAKALATSPEMIARRTEWVSEVINGTKHSPFSRIKSVVADITADEARARGYVKGNMKKDEIVKLLGRKTTPTTIYKKQKLDRDDIVDITDLDVVAWLKAEMRLMLDEELARAILLGDGREYGDEDKIDEESIRPIAKDDPMYAHPVRLAAGADTADIVEQLIRARAAYRGTGQPVLFTTQPFLTDLLLDKDKVGRRLYDSVQALATALMVSRIVPVEVMEQEEEVVAIMVNLADYTVGADRGGNVSMFDDFDIDYNQFKYLIETRASGALTKPKSAVVIKRTPGTAAVPSSPSFDGDTNTITIPSITGVVYTIEGIPVEGQEVITSTTEVEAQPAEGYSFPSGATRSWTFVPTPAGE